MFSPLRLGSSAQSVLDALSKSLAIIEFDTSGHILAANQNFCRAMGYEAEELIGQHHRMFVEPAYASSDEYAQFWAKLGRGEFDAREYKRFAKGGREVWIQATYNPVMLGNKVLKVVKLATDITKEKLRAAENASKLDPIFREQAVIEFSLNGEITTANENFLKTVGYRLDEITGRHHRMFVDPTYAQSYEYTEFWAKLNRGEYIAGEFHRFGKGGRDIWLQASYNPIFDMNGRVTKVVKFASDITPRMTAVSELGASLEKLANGVLDVKIVEPFSPELERLRLDFNTSIDALTKTLRNIRDNSSTIRVGTEEITTSSENLSKRTEQQAASLEQTAAALDEITATVRKTATGAAHVRDIVSETTAAAQQSLEVVRGAVSAMRRIEKSSAQISQIIGAIDEIAFQTSLLALNAGVEAARAGDAGRGFAVVASEVRGLAQHAAQAAKEIKVLIKASEAEIESGAGMVDETGDTLEHIVTKISEINVIVLEIAASASEQSTGLDQVNTAVNQMDQMTQQNAAMVQEAAAATQSLVQETIELDQLVAAFSFGKDRGVEAGPTEKVSAKAFGQLRAVAVNG
jgi:methyl-accepting chemotaxis protein